jgi:hypothetical protein
MGDLCGLFLLARGLAAGKAGFLAARSARRNTWPTR